MKKALIFLGTVIALASAHVSFAACTPVSSTYPGSLDTFVANDCIPSSWANTLESTIGTTTATTSLVQRIATLSSSTATTTITASGTTVSSPFTFASSTTILPFASGSQIYFALINSGNWLGPWQGVNSTTFYLASNPSNYLTGNQAITLNGAVSGIGATTITTAYNTSTLLGFFSANGTGLTYNSSTGAFTWTNPGYITTSSISINGTAGNVFTGISTSTGVSAGSCTNCNLSVNANGEISTFSNGSGGSGGALSSSTAITANEFPFWGNTTGGLAGTSTLTEISTTGINVTGTVNITGTSTLGSGIASGSTSTPISNFGPNSSLEGFFNLMGGRVMFGYDPSDYSSPALTFSQGSSKGFGININGTNGTFMGGTTAFYMDGGNTYPADAGWAEFTATSPTTSTIPHAPLWVNYTPPAQTTSSLELLGVNALSSGNASGTYLGLNAASSYNGDLLNLQENSTTIFKVTSSSIVTNNNLVDASGNPYVTSTSGSALALAFTTAGGVTDCGTSSVYAVVASTTITTGAHDLFLDGGVSINGINNDQQTMNVRIYIDGNPVGQTVTTNVAVPGTGTYYYESEVSYVATTTAATHTVALECNVSPNTANATFQTPFLTAKEMY